MRPARVVNILAGAGLEPATVGLFTRRRRPDAFILLYRNPVFSKMPRVLFSEELLALARKIPQEGFEPSVDAGFEPTAFTVLLQGYGGDCRD